MPTRRVIRPERGFGGFDDLPVVIHRRVTAGDLAATNRAPVTDVRYWMTLSGRDYNQIRIVIVGGQFVQVEISFDTTAEAEIFDQTMRADPH